MQLPSDFTDTIVRCLPPEVKEILMDRGHQLIVAGGFCRDVMTGRPAKDIDIFAISEPIMKDAIDSFGVLHTWARKQTANSVTFEEFFPTDESVPVQFITRVYYPDHIDLIHSFDFSVCQIGVYWQPGDTGYSQWVGICSDLFWRDIFSETATYTDPERDEDPGASLLRLVRFAGRGYKINEKDIAAVTGRFVSTLTGEPKAQAQEKVKKVFRSVGYAGRRVELEPVEDRRDVL